MSLRRLRGLKVVYVSRMILRAADTILNERINRDSGLLENWCTTSKMELETYLPKGAVIEFLISFSYCIAGRCVGLTSLSYSNLIFSA